MLYTSHSELNVREAARDGVIFAGGTAVSVEVSVGGTGVDVATGEVVPHATKSSATKRITRTAGATVARMAMTIRRRGGVVSTGSVFNQGRSKGEVGCELCGATPAGVSCDTAGVDSGIADDSGSKI